MATQAAGTNISQAEMTRRETPDGRLANLIDVISETNAIIDDADFIEANNGNYHEETRVASEPTGQERAYNQGIAGEAGVTEKVIEPSSMIDGLSEIDAAQLRHAPDPLGFRDQEDRIYLRGMAKTFASRLFDGNRSTNNLQINGINNRADYNVLSSPYTYDNGEGDTADASTFTSIYAIQWGPRMVQLFHPRNDAIGGDAANRGISLTDYGRSIIQDANASALKYPAFQTWLELHFGLFIFDPRKIRRIVNIATATNNGTTFKSFHEDHMIDLHADAVADGGTEGMVFYCNATVFAQIDKRANEKGNASFATNMEGEGPFAKPVTRWNGIPIRLVAQITSTQADIT